MAHRGVLLLLCLAALAPGVAAFLTPTLGGAYLLEQLTFSSKNASLPPPGGSFASATFQQPVTNAVPSGVLTNIVWDARNNSLAYMLDGNAIRVLDFANPTSASAVTTLVVPNLSYLPMATSICADAKIPQTLYVPGNWYGGNGYVWVIKLDFTNGARGSEFQAVSHKRAASRALPTAQASRTWAGTTFRAPLRRAL